ncbi:MAG: hypothetical protein GC165_07865 [Armatimonadetes bacterium]|nr:hypothetical protein [Armatimonadota bacterium]
MLSLALATVLGFQQSTITFKSDFEPLGDVVARISAETHIPMAAFGDLKAYPVYINVKDVSVKDLLDKLASVSGAEWEKKDDNYYLIAPQDLRHDQEKAGDPDLIAAIEATINQPAPEKRKPADIEELAKGAQNDPKAISKMMGEIFGHMFDADEGTMNLLKVIGSKDLSSIVEGRRVVLSSTPTQMQALMPGKAINAIRDHIKKLAAEEPKAKAGNDQNQGFDMSMMFGGKPLRHPELVNQIQTFQAIFQISQRKTLSVEIAAYTGDGVGVYSRTVQLPIVNPEDARPKVKGETKLDVAVAARNYAQALEDGKKIDPFMGMLMKAQSGFAGAMSMFVGEDSIFSQTQVPTPHGIPASIQSLMADPKKNEPLAYLLGPILDYEASQGKNVVALPSDDVIQTLAEQLIKPDQTIEGVMDSIDRSLTEKIAEDGSWQLMQASSPLELRSAFCKRDALSNLIKAGQTKGYVNLDDCATFATAQDSARGSELLALPLVTAVFHTSDLGSASALTSIGFDSLKLYATLTDFQKESLAAKRPVSLAALTPPQRTILSRMVYNGTMPPMKFDDEMAKAFGADSEDTNDMAGMTGLGMSMAGPLMSMLGMGESAMDSERTVLLPDGIPVVGSIQLKTMALDSVKATDKSTGNSMITMPEMLSMMNSDIPGFGAALKRNFDEYHLAKQTSYILFFRLGRNASYIATLYDVSVDNSKAYTKDQLPQSLQDRMKAMDGIKAAAAKAGGNPPVPPKP